MEGVSTVYPLSRDQVSGNIQRLRESVDQHVVEAWISNALQRAQTVPCPTNSSDSRKGAGHGEGAACDLSVWLEAEQISLLYGSLLAELPGKSESVPTSWCALIHMCR